MRTEPTIDRDPVDIGVNVVATIRDAETGETVDTIESHNLVTLAGRNLIRDLLNESTDTGLNYFAIGTGTTTPAAEDTGLVVEALRDVFTTRTASEGALTIAYFLPSTALNGSTLTEAGIFTASTAGTLFARVTHTAIAKTSSITVTYTWTITIGAS